MKKYTNTTDKLRTVVFEDGSAQFLMRGQSIKTDKNVKNFQDGIKVTEVVTVKVSKPKTESRKKSTSTDTDKK